MTGAIVLVAGKRGHGPPLARAAKRLQAKCLAPGPRTLTVASSAILAIEVIGFLMLLVPIPLAWMWIGGAVFRMTGSMSADLLVALVGFLVTSTLVIAGLTRLDRFWIRLRRSREYEQKEGALNRIVVASMTVGIAGFLFWFHASGAFIIPFMPTS